jgi:hypothetical protein
MATASVPALGPLPEGSDAPATPLRHLPMDIIRSIPLQGLQSPFNSHAFRSVTVFLPAACMVCHVLMYTWTDVVSCVKCNRYSHRSCMRSKDVLCARFAHRAGSSSSSSSAFASMTPSASPRGSIRRKSLSPRQAAGRCIWRHELKNLATSTNLFYKSKNTALNIDSIDEVLANRGSSHSRSSEELPADPLLQQSNTSASANSSSSSSSSSGGSIDLSRSLQLLNDPERRGSRRTVANGIEIIVEAILTDKSSFACVVLNSFLPKLLVTLESYKEFPDITSTRQSVSQYEELLKHARQCFDAISLAVVASLPLNEEDTMDSIFLTAVVNICDNYIMCKYQHEGKMLYDELMAICSKACAYTDRILHESLDSIAKKKHALSSSTSPSISLSQSGMQFVVGALNNVCAKTSGLNKLRNVVTVLHYVANGDIEEEKNEQTSIPPETDDNTVAVITPPTRGANSEIGADLLLEMVTDVLLMQARRSTSAGADADSTSTESPEWNASPVACNWNAQCMFMSFLTAEIPSYATTKQSEYNEWVDTNIINDGGWTLGAEGYALATLQTALYSISSHTEEWRK